MKKISKGFTLIEMLVVVLIIGILSALALPRYQLAVDKTHFANLQSQVKAIRSSFDNYYLATGEYPSSFDELDIDFSSSYTKTNPLHEQCYVFKDSYCCIGKHVTNYQNYNVVCGMNDYSFAYKYSVGKFTCVAANENNRAERLCNNISTNKYYCGNHISPYGHNTNNGNGYICHDI